MQRSLNAKSKIKVMRYIRTTFIGCLLVTATVLAEDGAAGTTSKAQTLYEAASQASFVGPEECFTGNVRVDLLFPKNENAEFSGAYVTFQPGARTA